MMIKYCFFSIFCFIHFSCSDENYNSISQIPFGTEASLDVITWNIENFPKNSVTNEYVSDLINAFDNINIIALQEISDQDAFTNLVDLLGNDIWVGYRDSNSNYQELSYLINTTNVEVIEQPYTILEDQEYYFAYRAPYVIKILFNNIEYIIIDVHLKCCGDGELILTESDEEYRRLQSNYYLKQFIDSHFSNENIIILGDFNDELNDPDQDNVFLDFINDPNYYFADIDIANGPSEDWSYPGWPSHLDHILIYNQYSEFNFNIQTLRLDDYLIGGWGKYKNYISDHRPVGINILFD